MTNYRNRQQVAAEEIDAAETAVARAVANYSRNGNCDVVNKANQALADAHEAFRCASDGRVDIGRLK
jgi:hypothetical protein